MIILKLIWWLLIGLPLIVINILRANAWLSWLLLSVLLIVAVTAKIPPNEKGWIQAFFLCFITLKCKYMMYVFDVFYCITCVFYRNIYIYKFFYFYQLCEKSHNHANYVKNHIILSKKSFPATYIKKKILMYILLLFWAC